MKRELTEEERGQELLRLALGAGESLSSLPSSEAAPTASSTLPAQWIGEYRLIRLLGEGGMGLVYEAEQQHPRRAVALKQIKGGAFVTAQHVKLFEREVKALARLKHPGIAAIYESGRTPRGE